MTDRSFWQGKKVFLTGHTGFKGSWLSIWLNALGANVTGYALRPPTNPSLFQLCHLSETMDSIYGDVRDAKRLQASMIKANPEIVIHMAAQSLVRQSYINPVETYETNVLGTVNLLEAVRRCKNIKAVLNITTDKCYENQEWVWGYRENEPLGGYDPYSSSKACAELVTAAYRTSFFQPDNQLPHTVAIATARAGNVIGGGDWAADRLIPDCIRALLKNEKIVIRNPQAIRPWQYVLEPLSGYLLLGRRLYEEGESLGQAWNFGPDDCDAKPVGWIVKKMCEQWGEKAAYVVDNGAHPHEARYLKLDCSKAKTQLGWKPRWNIEQAMAKTIEWFKYYQKEDDILCRCVQQIKEFEGYNDR